MKYRITQKDFMLANRKAAREEEIESHGKQIIFRKYLELVYCNVRNL